MAALKIVLGTACPESLSQSWSSGGLSYENFIINRVLNPKGSTTTLLEATCIGSYQKCVLKRFPKNGLKPLPVAQLLREIHLHRQLSHPSIVDFYAAFETIDGPEGPGAINIIMEFLPMGDLFSYAQLRRGKGQPLLEYEVVRRVLIPLLDALQYLHSKGFIHRDVKPENILMTPNGVKLCDFGLSINQEEERPVTRLGTLEYMSPEVLNGVTKLRPEEGKEKPIFISEKTDIWAVGILLFELCTGSAPFTGQSSAEMLASVHASVLSVEGMSIEMSDLILSCLNLNPSQRPAASALLKHPLIAKYANPPPPEPVTRLRARLQKTASMPVLRAAADLAQEGQGSASGKMTAAKIVLGTLSAKALNTQPALSPHGPAAGQAQGTVAPGWNSPLGAHRSTFVASLVKDTQKSGVLRRQESLAKGSLAVPEAADGQGIASLNPRSVMAARVEQLMQPQAVLLAEPGPAGGALKPPALNLAVIQGGGAGDRSLPLTPSSAVSKVSLDDPAMGVPEQVATTPTPGSAMDFRSLLGSQIRSATTSPGIPYGLHSPLAVDTYSPRGPLTPSRKVFREYVLRGGPSKKASGNVPDSSRAASKASSVASVASPWAALSPKERSMRGGFASDSPSGTTIVPRYLQTVLQPSGLPIPQVANRSGLPLIDNSSAPEHLQVIGAADTDESDGSGRGRTGAIKALRRLTGSVSINDNPARSNMDSGAEPYASARIPLTTGAASLHAPLALQRKKL